MQAAGAVSPVFEKIYAPFDGVITARGTSTWGTLIDAAPPDGCSTWPPTTSARLRERAAGLFARRHARARRRLTLPSIPGRIFQGKIVRTSNAIDPAFRTLLVEVEVDNREPTCPGRLRPGPLQAGQRTPTADAAGAGADLPFGGAAGGVVRTARRTWSRITLAATTARPSR